MTRDELRQLTDRLEIIADWKQDIQTRIDRAQLCFELIGLSEERHAELIREGTALKRLCRSLADRVGGAA